MDTLDRIAKEVPRDDVSVRVRFAPSPTGELHIGSVRTILYNYLFAKQREGTLVLRIEDTDQDRLVPDAVDSIYEGLRWLGIRWDEGPREGGPHAPYVQSERLALYHEHARRLLDGDWAYPCFCSKERLADMRARQQARGEVTRYDGLCRVIPRSEARARMDAGEEHVVRLKVPEEGGVGVRDAVHGAVSWELRTIEDQVLLKSDGFPTYHLAVVVDDRLMAITHVLRGDEWLPSLPKHLVLYRAFGWETPEYAHLPLVLGPDKKRLSKRHGAASVREYRDQGYIPEGIINHLALLGWAPGTEEEVFAMDDLVERWRLDHVQAAPAIFDRERLDHFNGMHIRRLAADELARRLRPYLPENAPEDTVRRAAPLVQERIETLAAARPLLDFLFTDELAYDPDLLLVRKRSAREVREALLRAARELREAQAAHADVEARLRALGAALGWSAGDLFMAIRVAVTGKKVTPPLIESILVLGRDRAVARLERAADALQERVAL